MPVDRRDTGVGTHRRNLRPIRAGKQRGRLGPGAVSLPRGTGLRRGLGAICQGNSSLSWTGILEFWGWESWKEELRTQKL